MMQDIRTPRTREARRLVRKISNRKGMWTQMFMIAFFVLLVVFSIILLSLDSTRSSLDAKRKFLDQDLVQQQADTTLIGLMRSPVTSQDGKTMMLADVIASNEDGSQDRVIYDAIKPRLTASGVYGITISSSHSLKLTPEKKMITTSDGRGLQSYLVGATSKLYLPGSSGNIEVTLVKYNVTQAGPYELIEETTAAKVESSSAKDLLVPKDESLADAAGFKKE